MLRQLRPHFGRLGLGDPAAFVVAADRYLALKAQLNKKTTANHLTLLLAILRLAVDLGWMDRVPRIRKPRVRLLSQDNTSATPTGTGDTATGSGDVCGGPAAGGAPAACGSSGGAEPVLGGAATDATREASGDDGGGGCRAAPRPSSSPSVPAGLVALVALARRRRRAGRAP